MFCKECGKQIVEGARFCKYCGWNIEEAQAQVQSLNNIIDNLEQK